MTIAIEQREGKPKPGKARKPDENLEFCWRFKHPKFGWCGGHTDDRWTTSRTDVETCMRHCQYPTELLQRRTESA